MLWTVTVNTPLKDKQVEKASWAEMMINKIISMYLSTLRCDLFFLVAHFWSKKEKLEIKEILPLCRPWLAVTKKKGFWSVTGGYMTPLSRTPVTHNPASRITLPLSWITQASPYQIALTWHHWQLPGQSQGEGLHLCMQNQQWITWLHRKNYLPR